MIAPLIVVWVAAGHDPALVGVTGLGLAACAWLLFQLAPPPADPTPTPRDRHVPPCWLDMWDLSADTPTPTPSRGEELRFVTALTGLFNLHAPPVDVEDAA